MKRRDHFCLGVVPGPWLADGCPAASELATIHDFGGFDPALYDILCPASGSPLGAQEVVAALRAAGLPVSTDAERHGAWVPLSIQHHGGPEHAFRVGQALAPLTEQQAQPRDEHLLPLFTALGAAGPTARARALHRGISDHVIAMDSYAFARWE